MGTAMLMVYLNLSQSASPLWRRSYDLIVTIPSRLRKWPRMVVPFLSKVKACTVYSFSARGVRGFV